MKFKTEIGIVKLSKERSLHILQHHPIMEDHMARIREVLEKPEEIRYSSRSDEILLFYRYFDNIEDGKYIVVVINKTEKEAKTAYLSHRIKIGRKYETKEKFSA